MNSKWSRTTTCKVSFVDETKIVKTKHTGKNVKEPNLKSRLRKDLRNNSLLKNYFVFHNSDSKGDLTVYQVKKDKTEYETIRNQHSGLIKTENKLSSSKPTELLDASSSSQQQHLYNNNSIHHHSEVVNIVNFLSSIPLTVVDQLDKTTIASLFGFETHSITTNQ